MQPPDGPDSALDAAYRRTRYEVDAPGGLLVLQIDAPSVGLAELHRQLGVTQSAFLTAWNPRSVPRMAAQNAAALGRLRLRIAELGAEPWPGRGRDPTGAWPAEESLFVPGLEIGIAGALAADFGQNALVYAAADAVPRLLWVSSLAGSDPPAAPGTATSGS